ncbi:hypothetical protein D6774_04600 [Candidatus Woesearchaeota archaeon]|nr:MAG: hypothetical protein D6774_04600 [Candidatus Woesearchaeota archaeon]
MAKAKRKNTKSTDKWKKKKWFKVLAPKLFKEQEIGETLSSDPELLNGRRVQVNMATLTGNMKAQNHKITFEVNKVQGGVCHTTVKRYEMIPSTIRRKVKRGKDRVDDSFVATTKDNVSVRIKPLMITEGHTSRAVKTLMRKRFIYDCRNALKEKSWDAVMLDILTGKLLKESKKNISKIYPLRALEMRVIERIEGEPLTDEEVVFTSERPQRRERRSRKEATKQQEVTPQKTQVEETEQPEQASVESSKEELQPTTAVEEESASEVAQE